jgi:hypothetical protein
VKPLDFRSQAVIQGIDVNYFMPLVSAEDMAMDNVYWIWQYSKSSAELESHDDMAIDICVWGAMVKLGYP